MNQQIKLEKLRTINQDVLSALSNILNDKDVYKYLPFTNAPSEKEVKNFLENLLNKKALIWIIYYKNNIVGIIDLIETKEKTVSLAYFIDKKNWRKGITSYSIKEIIKYCSESQNFDEIIAPVVSRNLASVKILEKNGFSFFKTSKTTVKFDGKEDKVLVYSLNL